VTDSITGKIVVILSTILCQT